MSRYYQINVIVNEHDPSNTKAIIKRLYGESPFDDHDIKEDGAGKGADELWFTGQFNLTGGEGEDEYASRLFHAVWEANNDEWCFVNVEATYLEELPYNEYTGSEWDYERWMEKRTKQKHLEETIKAATTVWNPELLEVAPPSPIDPTVLPGKAVKPTNPPNKKDETT